VGRWDAATARTLGDGCRLGGGTNGGRARGEPGFAARRRYHERPANRVGRGHEFCRDEPLDERVDGGGLEDALVVAQPEVQTVGRTRLFSAGVHIRAGEVDGIVFLTVERAAVVQAFVSRGMAVSTEPDRFGLPGPGVRSRKPQPDDVVGSREARTRVGDDHGTRGRGVRATGADEPRAELRIRRGV